MARSAFVTSSPLFSRRRNHESLTQYRQRTTKFTTISQTPSSPSPVIPGTPCFTPNILATPMSPTHRDAYLHSASDSLRAYLTNLDALPHPPRAKLTLLPPQLNPQLDVYDRRFLLQLVWAAVSVTASLGMRTRVLIQGARNFGAVPLSIAGLRRNFDADLALSLSDWPVKLRSGELENPDDVDDEDDIFFVVSPTNAVSIPIVNGLQQVTQRIADRPVVLINPRLDDVPSHSGVMQVSGRAERINFLKSFQDVFYMRLLFKAGTSYPLRGILYHSYPGPWQIWRPSEGTSLYDLIFDSNESPESDDISTAFSRDSYKRQKELWQGARDDGVNVTLDSLLTSPQILAFLGIACLVAAAALMDNRSLQLFVKLATTPVAR